jgi:hypothetical protein
MTGTDPSANKGAKVNQGAAQRRSESFYLVYAALGPSRSLTKLQKTLADLGLKISANTLKTYSARYNWQHRAELVDGAHTAVELATVPREMDERQGRLAVAMQALAREKLESIDPLHLSVRDAIHLLRVGTDIERLTRGQATTRAELTVQVLNPVINELVALFAEVNVIEDADTRLAAWATKAKAIVETYTLPAISNKNRSRT